MRTDRSGRLRQPRLIISGVLVAAGAATLAAWPLPAAGDKAAAPSAPPAMVLDDAALLPDLQSLPAENVHLDDDHNGARAVRLTGVLLNRGPGPLEMRPARGSDCDGDGTDDDVLAEQAVAVDSDGDGAFDRQVDSLIVARTAGCMVDHPDHAHWHFDAFAAYELWPVGDEAGRRTAALDKVSFCLVDVRRVEAAVPTEPTGRQYEGCGRDAVQGVSPGWADVYGANLPGQAVPLPPDVQDGLYCLVTRADPFGLIAESDETNNAASVRVRLNAGEARADGGPGCEGRADGR